MSPEEERIFMNLFFSIECLMEQSLEAEIFFEGRTEFSEAKEVVLKRRKEKWRIGEFD